MSRVDLAGVVRELRRANSFLVVTHVAPDGDAIGSLLTTYHLLRAMGKESITCACADPIPRVYRFLPGADIVVNASGVKGPYDLVVIVDVSRRERIGDINAFVGDDARILVIDHHLEDAPCGTLNFIDSTYAAVGEILTEVAELTGVPLTREAAECAYVALTTDTGSFRFSSTTERSHRMAARLLATGIDAAGISARVFDVMSMAKFRLFASVLDRVQFTHGGRVAFGEVTASEMQALYDSGEDLDGLINIARYVDGVTVAILFKEIGPRSTKLSFRSKAGFNSARFLQRFGGGGHAAAAGATIPLPLREAREMVLDEISLDLGERV